MLEEIQISRGEAVIADGDPRGLGIVEELLVNGTAVLDVTAFLFATSPTIFDRDLRTNVVTLKIFRELPTRAASLNRALRTPRAQLGVADFTITLIESGVSYAWTAAAAGWSPISVPEFSGYSGVLGYQITCGDLTTELFDAGEHPALLGEDGQPLRNEDGAILFNA